MAKVFYSNTAKLEIAAANTSIREYFETRELYELVDKHIEKFKAELIAKEAILSETPKFYRIRSDGAFYNNPEKIRSFMAYWFLVFYTYDETADEVVIWFVRSAKSDYSNILYLSRTR